MRTSSNSPLYDSIGSGYGTCRLPDRRIVEALRDQLGLPAGATLVDVGSGTGKYSVALAELGYQLIAIEPSEVMKAQAISHPRVRTIDSNAESIPLPSNTAHGAFIVLAYHHFSDRVTALNEILRVVGDGPLVIFTFEPESLRRIWLAEYFPSLGRENGSYSRLSDVATEVQAITSRKIRKHPFFLPRDLTDRFAAASWANPEEYFDQSLLQGISSFRLMTVTEREAGLQRLRGDLQSGMWDSKFGHLRNQDTYDAGYCFITASKVLSPQ